jgi:DNA-binding Lrp family transcriptional regulator
MDKEIMNFTRNALLGNISGQPLCASYKAALRQCSNDKEMLVRLALQQQSMPYVSTACYKKLGVTKEYIMKNYAEYINGNRTFEDVEGVSGYTYQMYVGYDKDFVVTADVTSMMWCDNLMITIIEKKCPTIYISNKSVVRLNCDGFNYVNIKLFDDSKLVVGNLPDNSNVVVYKYSNSSKVETDGNCFGSVKVFNKQLKL